MRTGSRKRTCGARRSRHVAIASVSGPSPHAASRSDTSAAMRPVGRPRGGKEILVGQSVDKESRVHFRVRRRRWRLARGIPLRFFTRARSKFFFFRMCAVTKGCLARKCCDRAPNEKCCDRAPNEKVRRMAGASQVQGETNAGVRRTELVLLEVPLQDKSRQICPKYEENAMQRRRQ